MTPRIEGAGNAGPIWHCRTFEDVARELGTNPETGVAVEALSPIFPPMASGFSASRQIWRILWTQLKGGVILVLLVASVASLLLGHISDALAIVASVAFSVAFGFATDWRAERALEALRTLSAPTARVIRSGLESEVRTDDVRRGDLLILSPGRSSPRTDGSRRCAISRSTSRPSPARACP